MRTIALFILGVGFLSGNEALDLIEEEVTGRPYVPLQVVEPKKDLPETSELEGVDAPKKKLLHLMPSPWLDRRPQPLATFENPEGVVTEASFGGLVEASYQRSKQQGGAQSVPTSSAASLRRARFTAMLHLQYATTLEASGLLDEAGWAGVDRLSLRHYFRPDTAVTVGKFRPAFGHFYATDPSVRELPELPSFTAQTAPGNTLGVYLDHGWANWEVGGGWFSGDLESNVPGVSGSGFLMGHLSQTFFKSQEKEEFSRWYLSGLWNFEENRSETLSGGSRQVLTSGLQFQSGLTDIVGELTLAHGGELGSAWGLTAKGSRWMMRDVLKLVTRYHYAGAGDSATKQRSGQPLSDFGALRVALDVPAADSDALGVGLGEGGLRANELHQIYAGLNLYLLDPHLTLRAGGEYTYLRTRMGESLQAWNLLTSVRATF